MMFDWCQSGQHDQCRREYQRFYIDPRTNKVVWLDETRYCECRKRGCPCYVPAKERSKKTKTNKRRKK